MYGHDIVLKTQELLTLQTDLLAQIETIGIVDPVFRTRSAERIDQNQK